jgi:hypothetical protein
MFSQQEETFVLFSIMLTSSQSTQPSNQWVPETIFLGVYQDQLKVEHLVPVLGICGAC